MAEKVVSFKTSDEIYNKLKESGKSFRSIIEPLVINFFNEEPRYTRNIRKQTLMGYVDICKWLDSIKGAEK
jgi:hypothetical protein